MPEFGQPVGAEWRPVLSSDTAANDSDKTVTVPAGKEWDVQWVYAELATSGTPGNRTLAMYVLDASGNIIFRAGRSGSLAASTTWRAIWGSLGGVANPYAVQGPDGELSLLPFPQRLVLPAGFGLRIFDISAIDVAADDLTLRIMVLERDLV